MSSFKPVIITTTNIKESLAGFCKEHSCELESINFDIIGFNTFYNKRPSTQCVQLTAERKRQIIHIKNLTNNDISLKEQYKIKIYPRTAIKGVNRLLNFG